MSQQDQIIRIDGQGGGQNQSGEYEVVFSGPADYSESLDDPNDFSPVGSNTVSNFIVEDPGDTYPNQFNKDWTRGPLPAQVTITGGGPLRFVLNPANDNDREGQFSVTVSAGESRTIELDGGGDGDGDGIGPAQVVGGLVFVGALGAVAWAVTRNRDDNNQRRRRR